MRATYKHNHVCVVCVHEHAIIFSMIVHKSFKQESFRSKRDCCGWTCDDCSLQVERCTGLSKRNRSPGDNTTLTQRSTAHCSRHDTLSKHRLTLAEDVYYFQKQRTRSRKYVVNFLHTKNYRHKAQADHNILWKVENTDDAAYSTHLQHITLDSEAKRS